MKRFSRNNVVKVLAVAVLALTAIPVFLKTKNVKTAQSLPPNRKTPNSSPKHERHIHVLNMMAVVVALGLLVIWMTPSQALAASILVIDSTGNVGRYTSLALDNGIPIISYYDRTNGTLKLARCNNNTTCDTPTFSIIDTIGDGLNGDTAVVVASDGIPVIAYYEGINQDLKLARCNNNTTCDAPILTTIDTVGIVGTSLSLVLGSGEIPIISYYDTTNRDLKLARCNNNTTCNAPTLTTVDTGGTADVGQDNALAVAAGDIPVIAYVNYTNSRLQLARCNNNTTCNAPVITVVDAVYAPTQFTSLMLDSNGNPIIAYSHNNGLKLARCNNTACTTPTVRIIAIGGSFNSLRLDTGDIPVISYETNNALYLARCNDSTCTAPNITALDNSSSTGYWSSLVLDQGVPVIAYATSSEDVKLYIARNRAPSLATNIPRPVAFRGTALISNAYLNATDPDNAPMQTLTYTVVAPPTEGFLNLGNVFTQAQINANGLIYQHDGQLSDQFSFTISDGISSIGPYVFSISLTDSTLTPTVTRTVSPVPFTPTSTETYFPPITITQTASPVYTASFTPTTTLSPTSTITPSLTATLTDFERAITTVDNNGQTGWYSAVAVNNYDLPVIAYVQSDTYNLLRLAICNSALCNAPTLRSLPIPNQAESLSLVLDQGFAPIVSYYDRAALAVKLVRCGTVNCPNWEVQRIDDANSTTLTTDVALDNNGLAWVAYQGIDYTLRVAHCGDWACTTPNIITLDYVAGAQIIGISMETDSSGLPIISYTVQTNGFNYTTVAKIARCNSIACDAPTIIPITTLPIRGGDRTSLALLNGDIPIFIFGTGNTHLVRCNDMVCSSSIVTELDISSSYFSLALDNNDNPMISTFTGGSSSDLQLVRCNNNTTCNAPTRVTIDGVNNVGMYNSIASDSAGNPVISYLDYTNTALKLYNGGYLYVPPTVIPSFTPTRTPRPTWTISPTPTLTLTPSLTPTSTTTPIVGTFTENEYYSALVTARQSYLDITQIVADFVPDALNLTIATSTGVVGNVTVTLTQAQGYVVFNITSITVNGGTPPVNYINIINRDLPGILTTTLDSLLMARFGSADISTLTLTADSLVVTLNTP